jgi:hypothetical protein
MLEISRAAHMSHNDSHVRHTFQCVRGSDDGKSEGLRQARSQLCRLPPSRPPRAHQPKRREWVTFWLMPELSPPYAPSCAFASRTWPLRLMTARRYFSRFLARGLRSI